MSKSRMLPAFPLTLNILKMACPVRPLQNGTNTSDISVCKITKITNQNLEESEKSVKLMKPCVANLSLVKEIQPRGEDVGYLVESSGGTGFAFLSVCAQNKRTKKALWPIIQENVTIGTTIYSDGWRAYRKLPTIGYPHRWLDHSQYYVHPDDPTLNTNKIEGFWGNWKRWLPSSGPYNLEQYLYTYLWFHQKKLQKIDPFWSLVELVAQNNSINILNKAMNIGTDTEGQEYDEEQERLDEAEIARLEDDYDTDSETDDESAGIPSYSCPFCQKTSETKEEVLEHMETCEETNNEDDEDSSMDESMFFDCPYCQERFESNDEFVRHIDIH